MGDTHHFPWPEAIGSTEIQLLSLRSLAGSVRLEGGLEEYGKVVQTSHNWIHPEWSQLCPILLSHNMVASEMETQGIEVVNWSRKRVGFPLHFFIWKMKDFH